MYRLAVCDDEKEFAEKMKGWISAYFIDAEKECNVEVCYSGEELLQRMETSGRFHIVFLEMNMKGMNGIETAEKIRTYSKSISIIFVTASPEYMIEGYKVKALRYLLKNNPEIKNILYEALDAACEEIQADRSIVTIPFMDGVLSFSNSNILYIESENHNVSFYIMGKGSIEKHGLRATMDEAMEYTDENTVRVHRSFSINLKYCTKISYQSAKLTGSIEIPVSRGYTKEVKERFYQYKGMY